MEKRLGSKNKSKGLARKGVSNVVPAIPAHDDDFKGNGINSGRKDFHFKRQPDYYPEWESKLSEGILDVPSLQLCEVPQAIFDYRPSIKIIYMKQNYIRQLPEHFFDELPNLAWLDVRNNKMRSIPEFKLAHSQLRVLLLQDNELRCLPLSLCLASKLKNIGLTGNPLEDPPEEVRNDGCFAILSYLKSQMLSCTPKSAADESTQDEDNALELCDIISPFDDAQLVKDLEETVLKLAQRDIDTQRLSRQHSDTKSNSDDWTAEDREAKRIERLKYTWGLWKNVVYDGPSAKKIFEDQYAVMQNELLTKTATQKNTILQRIRNQEALRKWRHETSVLQRERQYNRSEIYQGLEIPFGTDDNIPVPVQPKIPLRVYNAEDFEKELTQCYDQLNDFASNPVSLTNVNQALKRLEEVESVQQKLLGMRMSVKSAVPN